MISGNLSHVKNLFNFSICVFVVSLVWVFEAVADISHPRLLLTPSGVSEIRQELGSVPTFFSSYEKTKIAVQGAMRNGFDVPVPKDGGGGYTHEEHKKNYQLIHDAGVIYQLTGELEYAEFASDILLAYAELYPKLGRHPVIRSSSPGRLFWQSLNEAVWLLHAIQGYDAIKLSLNVAQQKKIESQLFVPLATFLSEGQPETFDRIHNHGTWATAAVGMTGYVLGRADFVNKALYGLDGTGGSGFIRQLDLLFSPDGYYNEGPYYQRYALMPFVVFARVIDNNDPGKGIFQYRDSVLLKAIYALIDLSYDGLFFPINDAIKDKGLTTRELIYGVAVAYSVTGDINLLSIAKHQGAVTLTDDGLTLAKAIDKGLASPYPFKSKHFRDGALGDRGALSVLRSGSEAGHQALVLKNTSQGLGHGHFDRLNFLYYDNGREIVKDYGAARFLNVEPKNGGHYLPENLSWAKQTVAHNTLVVDEQSHFEADWMSGETASPVVDFVSESETLQLVSSTMRGAYEDVTFTRTMALLEHPWFERGLVIDILRARGNQLHQFDLPLHYTGAIVNHNLTLESFSSALTPLGNSAGYQHLWLKARSSETNSNTSPQVSWLEKDRFYTLTSAAGTQERFLFVELGANDPEFNLLPGRALIRRIQSVTAHSFASVLESHGRYDGVLEYTRAPYPKVASVILESVGSYDALRVTSDQDGELVLLLSYDANPQTEHRAHLAGQVVTWNGFYTLVENSL